MYHLQTVINNYLIYCQNQKRLDPKTLKAYRIDLTQFTSQIRVEDEVFEAYYNYGTLYYLKGNYSKALEYYEYALDEVPETLTMDVTLLHTI